MPTSPVPSSYAGYPMDMDDWDCEQWKQYYIANKTALGQDQAVSIVNNDSQRIGTFANVYSCAFDCDWASYMAGEGLDPSNIFSLVYCSTKDVAKTVNNVTDTAATLTSNKVITTVAIVGIGYLAYKMFTK